MKKQTLFINAFLALGFILSAEAQFRDLWRLGEEDGGAGEFTQELGGSDAEPGSATYRDDDYYFAGTYPEPIGVLTEDETITDLVDTSRNSANPTGFSRAVTQSSTNNRIHFNLSASEADAGASYQFTLNLFGGGYWDPAVSGSGGFGTHDVEVLFNDTVIKTFTDITEATPIVETLDPTTVGAVEGANKIEIIRTGGMNNGANVGWIVMDNVLLEIDESGIACTEVICNFTADAAKILPGGQVTLNWLTAAGATLSIDNGVGAVDAGAGSIVVSPTKSTTYTLSSTLGTETATAEVTVLVDVLVAFGADNLNIGSSNPTATLDWEVDPSAGVTVSIDQGVGDVTAATTSGFGSILVDVTENTTYTITVTRPNTPEDEVETGTVTLNFDYDDYASLWILGVEDQSQGEFNQEIFGEFPAPGSAAARDDDYYFAGEYLGLIGTLLEDETVTDPVDQSNQSANPVGMERSVTNGSPRSRIHFILSASEAGSHIDFRLRSQLRNGGWWDGEAAASGAGFGVHDVDITFNGQTIFSEQGITGSFNVDQSFTATEGNAVVGENVVEVIRTGGGSNPADPDGNLGWIQFDFFSLEAREARPATIFGITDIVYNSTTEEVTITFPSSPNETFMIQSSEVLNPDFWLEQEEEAPAHATEAFTTFTFSSASPKLFVRVRRN
ncbi:hypothetical protein N9291_01025 [bacterium]|nr:hypothetical protein [bacterium]